MRIPQTSEPQEANDQSLKTNTRESIVFEDKNTSHPPLGEVSLIDLLFTDTHKKVSENKVLYVNAENPSHTVTYGQLKNQVLRCTASLKRVFDLKRGDVIAACSPDCLEYTPLFFASIAAGCVFSPMRISPISTAEDIVYDFHTLQPKLLILHASELDTLYQAAVDSGMSESHILIIGEPSNNPTYSHLQTVEKVLMSSSELAVPVKYTKQEIMESPCYLLFTSGSTGRRKAGMITQNALVFYFLSNKTLLRNDLSTMSVTGFSFASSLFTCVISPAYYGMTAYITDYNKRSLEDVCKTVQKYKISFLLVAPFIVYSLGRNPEISKQYDLSSIKLLICGGSATDQNMLCMLSGSSEFSILNMYAMTESLCMFSNDTEGSLLGSIGRVAYSNKVRIVDMDGNDQPVGKEGELRIKGPNTTPGYYRNPKATKDLYDEHGYLRTGDICKMGEDGRIYYIMRYKDLIKHKMFYYFPVDVEKVILTHPQVTDCAVIGVDSKEMNTEVARAYVTLVEGTADKNMVLKEIKSYTEKQLPESKHLHGGIFEIDTFPRTDSGKIKRFELRIAAKAS
ncbi:hypothetical protein BY458DRAFT_497477 [Sporodiniella umbellata]|nr:hypothetical protein BY458DRAFT_497477 [Sporodiniella umbellata]